MFVNGVFVRNVYLSQGVATCSQDKFDNKKPHYSNQLPFVIVIVQGRKNSQDFTNLQTIMISEVFRAGSGAIFYSEIYRC